MVKVTWKEKWLYIDPLRKRYNLKLGTNLNNDIEILKESFISFFFHRAKIGLKYIYGAFDLGSQYSPSSRLLFELFVQDATEDVDVTKTVVLLGLNRKCWPQRLSSEYILKIVFYHFWNRSLSLNQNHHKSRTLCVLKLTLLFQIIRIYFPGLEQRDLGWIVKKGWRII